MAPSSSCKYYDIDSILAEEELLPCKTLFDFAHLKPFFDSDLVSSSSNINKEKNALVLEEGTKVKLPIWACSKWSSLGYISVSMPRHFALKAREALEADASAVDLRKRNAQFFLSGAAVSTLLLKQQPQQAEGNASKEEAHALRQTLLNTYMGVRFRTTLDWSWSSVNDDVSHYMASLDDLERSLFRAGASAIAAATAAATLSGSNRYSTIITTAKSSRGRRIPNNPAAATKEMESQRKTKASRAVTPEATSTSFSAKRQRV